MFLRRQSCSSHRKLWRSRWSIQHPFLSKRGADPTRGNMCPGFLRSNGKLYYCYFLLKYTWKGSSLAAQRLGLQAFTAVTQNLIPGGGPKDPHKPHSQKEKYSSFTMYSKLIPFYIYIFFMSFFIEVWLIHDCSAKRFIYT